MAELKLYSHSFIFIAHYHVMSKNAIKAQEFTRKFTNFTNFANLKIHNKKLTMESYFH